MQNMKNLGPIVRTLRKKKDLSLEFVANEVGYDAGNLSKFERRLQDTDESMLKKIAKVIGTDLPELLRMAAQIEESASDAYPQKYHVTESATVHYLKEPKAVYLEVNNVPVFQGEHILRLADNPSSIDKAGIEQSIPGPANQRPDDFAMLIGDDTMTAQAGAKISYPLGQFAYFDPTIRHESGDAVIVVLSKESFAFTTVQHINGVWMMVPLNSRYPARELPMNAKVVAVAFGTHAVTRAR